MEDYLLTMDLPLLMMNALKSAVFITHYIHIQWILKKKMN